ncbi:MAG: noncanonical pyrimidine nucleotidase, YjjG family [Flavobacteriaceae bacterium]|nr:noncanonical pyrimidine nucleotidase, YjjG family [Flavobacteriaceae bacterium]
MPDKNQITDVFFDLDHTLWDFEKNSALTFEKIFDQLKINLNLNGFLEAYEGINHHYWKLYRENKISQEELRHKRLIKTFEAIDFDFDPQKIESISDQYILHLSTFSNLFEGAISLLDGLKSKYQLHVITNGFEIVQYHKIKNSGLSSYFKNVFTAEKVGYKKPHPIIFEHALDHTQTNAHNSLMIGDSLEADVLGAMNIGMQAIHFNSHNEPQHDHCPMVENLDEISIML